MAGKGQVTLTFAGDSKSLEKTFDRVGAGAKDMAKDFDKAGADAKRFGTAMDRASDATDASEGKFMGAADLLDGLGGAFGLPTEGATNLARSFGDLAGGFTALGPMIGKVGSALGGLALNPVVLGIAALTAGIVLLYQHSETFRDIITAVFQKVKDIAGPVLEGLGKAVSWVGGLFGKSGDDSKKMSDDLKAAFQAAADSARANFEAMAARAQEWRDSYSSTIQGITTATSSFKDQQLVTWGEWKTILKDNITAAEQWAGNITAIAKRGFGGLAMELAAQGTDMALVAKNLANAPVNELKAADKLYSRQGRLNGEAYAQGLQSTIDMFDPTFSVTRTEGGFVQTVRGQTTIVRRQHGGPVIAGYPYLVGEAGPEMFIPTQSGNIVPNGAGGGITIQAGAIITENQLADLVHKALLRKQGRSGSLGFA